MGATAVTVEKYAIEENVPIPPLGSRSQYPFAKMKPSSAFKIKVAADGDIDAVVRRARNAIYAFTQRAEYNGWKFSTRTNRTERFVQVHRIK